VGRRRDAFLRQGAERRGLRGRGRGEMGEDADRRGVETLPPVPPRHATGLERFHLRLSKTEHLAACAIFKSDTQSEGRARARPDAATPSAPGSWFAFDSAAAVHLTRDPRTVLRLGRLSFAIGVGAGLLLVLLTMNLALLFFGIAGAVLAWSYSSPPLQLSYRGVGEISTF